MRRISPIGFAGFAESADFWLLGVRRAIVLAPAGAPFENDGILYIARLSDTKFGRSFSGGYADNCENRATEMPKQKTHKGTKKRFRLTAKGKAKHRQAGTSHLASRKTKKTRRNLRGTRVLSKTVVHQITMALAGHSS
jgi:large subunit ribosomal protein L35